MSNLQRLLEKFRDDDRVSNLVDLINDPLPSRIQLKGLTGALDAFIITGTFLSRPSSHLVIASDKDEAAYLQNNIASLFEKKQILFFPDSFKKPATFEEINKSNILQRTETVNKMAYGNAVGEILVTYPEAIFEKVLAPAVIEENRIDIGVHEKVDLGFITEILVEYGFERTDFVFEPGQFSVRGGIVDIYSYANEFPYRVEFFDDEVESIRTFHPTSQLSQRELARVSILPNVSKHFSNTQKASLLAILPEDTTVWVNDFQSLLDKLQICFEKAEEYGKKIEKMGLLDEDGLETELLKERAFILPRDVIDDIKKRTIVELSNYSYFGEKGLAKVHEIDYHAKPQPSFNKNFELLIEDLNGNTAQGIENFLFTENPRQIERFYAIFEDMGATVEFHPIPKAIHQGFVNVDLKVACYTDHQIFERYHKFKLRKGFTKDQAINLRLLRELRPGDFVTHIDHGIGKYSGLEKIKIKDQVQEAVRLIYKNNDILYISINSLHKISKHSGKEGKQPKLTKLGSDTWTNVKRKAKRKLKDIAGELIQLYAKRKASKGHAFQPDGYLQNELEASFIYEDTPDQYKATVDVKGDMEKPYPMDRLVCGDVGFGKTEIAIRAAFKAVIGGKQVAILVPTTILALQHYKTLSERLSNFPVTIDYVNRFRSMAERRAIFKRLKAGEIDIVIGTHGLLNKEVGFKDLGLLVIDEEQKFGVGAKEKLRKFSVNVDTLTLTATPIPRTLQFSLMAARDLSVIRTPPPNRQPIHTERRVFNDELIKDSIYYEVYRGGQVFFVHNRVQSLPEMADMIRKLCPDIDIGMAHGQMEPKVLEKTLLQFIDHKYDVLVCTNIIETGLDIANANTIIINNAQNFGLSDLHQLRGRVGRSNKKAFCYLFAPHLSVLTPEARRRLKTLEEFSDLGSGFNIAMKDLDIRGAGNMLGGEQSGFITEIGFETYQKILDEAIQDLKETQFKDLFKGELESEQNFVRDVQLETDVEMLIPDEYVSNISERLNLYTELDNIKTEEGITEFRDSLKDRFGKIPKQVFHLFSALRLRWYAKKLGFERVLLKSGKLRCYFVSNPQSAFYETKLFQQVVLYVNGRGDRNMGFKQSKNYFILVRDDLYSLSEACKLLMEIDKAVQIALTTLKNENPA